MNPDKRRFPRQRKDAPLILLQPGLKRARESAILRDVSLGGLAFKTSLPLCLGSSFDFALYVPTRGWVDGTGRVCWYKREGDLLLCGASIAIRRWDQQKLLRRWLHPSSTGLLRFFYSGMR